MTEKCLSLQKLLVCSILCVTVDLHCLYILVIDSYSCLFTSILNWLSVSKWFLLTSEKLLHCSYLLLLSWPVHSCFLWVWSLIDCLASNNVYSVFLIDLIGFLIHLRQHFSRLHSWYIWNLVPFHYDERDGHLGCVQHLESAPDLLFNSI